MPVPPAGAAVGVAFWIFVAISPGYGQMLSESARVGITPAELELLDGDSSRRDYSCDLDVAEPRLGFDFRFHAGFRATIPLRDLTEEPVMTLVYRVRSTDLDTAPLYYRRQVEVPSGEGSRSLLLFNGEFSTGEGDYLLEVALVGAGGGACTEDFELRSRRSREGVPLTLPPGEVSWAEQQVGRVWPRTDSATPVRLKILVNVPPFRNSRKPLTATDVSYVVSFLKYVTQRTPLSEVSLTAFNLKEQRIIHRQPFRPWLSLVDLGRSMGRVESAQKISVDALRRERVRDFLSELIEEEIDGSGADAILLLGPLGFRGQSLKEVARRLRSSAPPLFYLRYRFRRVGPTFSDPLKDFVNEAGGQTYEIVDAYQLWEAVEKIQQQLQNR